MAPIPVSTITASDFLAGHLPVGLLAFEDGGIAGTFPSPAARKALLEEAKADGFKGHAGETIVLSFTDKGSKRRCVLVGLGLRKHATAESVRRACAAMLKASSARFEKLVVAAPSHA